MNTTDSLAKSTTSGSLSIGSSLVTIFITYVQPLFNVLGVVSNALIVIVFTMCLSLGKESSVVATQSSTSNISTRGFTLTSGSRKDRLATVSRIYYTLIAVCELSVCLFGFLIRNTSKIVSIWVRNYKVHSFQV